MSLHFQLGACYSFTLKGRRLTHVRFRCKVLQLAREAIRAGIRAHNSHLCCLHIHSKGSCSSHICAHFYNRCHCHNVLHYVHMHYFLSKTVDHHLQACHSNSEKQQHMGNFCWIHIQDQAGIVHYYCTTCLHIFHRDPPLNMVL